jgi:hypothetical protein
MQLHLAEVYPATRGGTSAMLNRVYDHEHQPLLKQAGSAFKAVPVIPGGEIRTVGAVI